MIMQKKSNMLVILVAALALTIGIMAVMSVTSYAATDTYTSLIPAKDDDKDTVAAKVVRFNGYEWYIIADDSTAENEGTVTLLTVKPIDQIRFDSRSCFYKDSEIKQYLDRLTIGDGSFAGVASAIAPTYLSDVKVSGAKLYLLSKDEAMTLSRNVITYTNKSDLIYEFWWLRTYFDRGVVCGDGFVGTVYIDAGLPVYVVASVRPALRLDLSKISFSLESKEFTLKNVQHLAPEADEIVSAKIKALPKKVTLKYEADVNAVVKAYLALSKAQRKFIVPELEQKLARAENAIITAKAKAKATRIIKVKNQKGRKVVVRWKKTPNVTGYQVRYSTSKNFRKNVVTKKTKKSATKITLTNLKKFEVINVEVIPYTKVTNRITKKSKVVLGKAQNTKKVKIVK